MRPLARERSVIRTPWLVGRQPAGRALPWVLGVLALVALLLLAGLKWGPHQMRHLLAERATAALGRPVSAGRIDVALLSSTLTVSDLKIDGTETGKPMLEVAKVRLALEPWTYIVGTLVVRSIELDTPKARVVRIAPDRLDLSDVIERFTNRPPSLRKTIWRINRIEVRDGSIALDDRVVAKSTHIEGLQTKIAGLTNQEDQDAKAATLEMRFTLDGRPTVIEAQADLFGESPASQGRAQLDALPLAAVRPYLPLPNDIQVSDGTLSLDLKTRFAAKPALPRDRLQIEGTATLNGLQVRDGAGTERASIGSVTLELAPSAPLGGDLHVARLALVEPRFSSGRNRDGTLSWPRPGPSSPSKSSGSSATPGTSPDTASTPNSASLMPHALKIAALSVESGRVNWLDEGLAPGFALRADGITIQGAPIEMADLTQAASVKGQIKASAMVDESTPVNAELTLEGTSGQATIKIDKVELARYARLAGPVLKAKIERGWGEAQAVVRWDSAASSWSVQDASASLNDVRVMQDARTPLAFSRLAASGLKVDPAARRIDVAAVGLDKASVAARRNREGRIDLQDLIAPSAPAPASSTSATSAQARPWALMVNEATVRQLDLDYRDALIPRDQALPRVRIDARAVNLSLDPARPIPFDATVALADGSRVQARGTARPAPMQLDTQLTLSRVALSYLDPYIEPYLNLTLARGQLSGGGRLQLTGSSREALNRIGFTGELSVNNFDTQDKVTREDFVRWSALALPSLKVDWKPADIPGSRIEIGPVALVDFYARVILSADGRLNLSQILIDPDKQASPVSITTAPTPTGAAPTAMGADRREVPKPPAADRARPSIHVGSVQIANGNVNFTDLFIRPNYTANLTQLTGSIDAIASDRPEPSEVRITGRVDDDTPLEITGRINPLAPTTQLDLQAVARGFDLPRLSPYSGRWAGYAIEKGKLTANVRYRIEGEQLQAENKLVINQLTFGEPVASADATKLPVKLAVSLLKDRNGNIDLDLPISGTVTDPQFSVGGLIWRALGNLILRVVTSPFTLLSSITGEAGTSDLSHLEFTAGKGSLDEDDQHRLDALVDAMTQRPGVSLEIAGFSDPVGDRDQLRHQRLERSLKSARLAEMRRTNRTSELPSVDEVTLSPQERVVMLEQIWRTEQRGAGTKGDAPLPEEMEKRLLAGIPIEDQDLLQLAQRRADAAHDYLRGKGIPDDRIFVLSPKLAQTGDTQPAARVSFSVR